MRDRRLLELIETCWQTLHTVSGRVLLCGIFRTDGGLEVRASYSDPQLVRSQRVTDITEGRQLAEEWRRVIATDGAFTATNGAPLS
jgi:hypothetical protein